MVINYEKGPNDYNGTGCNPGGDSGRNRIYADRPSGRSEKGLKQYRPPQHYHKVKQYDR